MLVDKWRQSKGVKFLAKARTDLQESSAGSTGAVLLLKANIHCFEPSEVQNVSIGDHKFNYSTA